MPAESPIALGDVLAVLRALVTLELAVLLLEQDRTAEVKALVPELAPIFQAQGVAREWVATLQLFQEAVEREVITVDLARRFLADLRRRPAEELSDAPARD